MMGGWGTRLVYNVDEGLGIISTEATYQATLLRTREDGLNQGA